MGKGKNKMLDMSFFHGTLKRKELKKFIKNYKKPIKYTYGIGYRNSSINKKAITKKEAFEIIEQESYLDAKESEDCLYLNAYSDGDLF